MVQRLLALDGLGDEVKVLWSSGGSLMPGMGRHDTIRSYSRGKDLKPVKKFYCKFYGKNWSCCDGEGPGLTDPIRPQMGVATVSYPPVKQQDRTRHKTQRDIDTK